MEDLFIIQDDYFICDSNGKICIIPFTKVVHYESDGNYSFFFDEKNEKRRIRMRLGEVIKAVNIAGLLRYCKIGILNLTYYDKVLPLKKGSNKHEILLKNEVKLKLPVERLKEFRKDADKYKLIEYTKQMFRH